MLKYQKNKMARIRFWSILCLLMAVVKGGAEELRRPISCESPAWIVHIDVWNYADPQKIIDMVPEDVRPFVIFNIATSSSDEKSASGPAIYDSWMKVCAQNRVWTMIQCASGAVNRMPDDGTTEAYEQYFIDYPNFLGFNFAEQFWGFGDEGYVDFPTRLQLFADLMPICHKYGGYLAVSFTDSYYNASKMPMAYLKRNEELRHFLENDPQHFLCFEKYTLKKNFLDIESNCLGHWLGGYAGAYGIRFDSSGWLGSDDVTDNTRGGSAFVRAAGAIPVAEHMMLTGVSIMDGPELTWTECSRETATTNDNGYTCRNWSWYAQAENITLDLFRKVLDGTIRIPSREEVIARTGVCIVNDINKNINKETERNSYITPEHLFDGLYRCDEDQNGAPNHWIANRWWLKATGRYPTIPQVYAEIDGMTCFKKSEYDKTVFDAWMQESFLEEYSGDIFAGRIENGWVTYNPYQYNESTTDDGYRLCSASDRRANGCIPLRYNSCEAVGLDYAPYSLGIIREYSDHITLYLTNYQTTGVMSEDTVRISGVLSQPAVMWQDRGNHEASTVASSWVDGVLTVTAVHNGPLDLTIECSGADTDRNASYTTATIIEPAAPPVYEGVLQYEAELADYKSVTIRKSGYNQGRDGFLGQGFAELGSRQSTLRFAVGLPKTGYYLLTLRYEADAAGGVLIGGTESVKLQQCDSWSTVQTIVKMDEGKGSVTLQNTGGTKIYVDCITLESIKAAAFTPDTEGIYHVCLSDLIASGNISFDAATGIVTQDPDNGQSGALRLFFDHADFTNVASLLVTYEGEGDIFRSLLITDNNGTSVNPTGTQGAFWSSKYALNYSDYQQADASSAVCKLEWTANTPGEAVRTMTIKDILIKCTVIPVAIAERQDGQDGQTVTYYDLQGRTTETPRRGIYIVKGKGKVNNVITR